jgi:hypothetical protein
VLDTLKILLCHGNETGQQANEKHLQKTRNQDKQQKLFGYRHAG